MTTRSGIARAVALGAALALGGGSFGCVTKGRYEELVSDRNTVLEERNALQAQVEGLREANDDLARRLEATETEVDEMKGTYEGLVSELQAEVEAGQIEVQQLVDGIRLNVSDELLFASGSAEINQAGRAVLERVADRIESEQAIVSVEGHTDDVPLSTNLQRRYPTNWELAGARAASVVRLLADHGVDPTRLRAVSRGPYAPVAPNDTAEGRAKNRRTEILLRPIPQ